MANFIPLRKIPESPDERRKLLEERVNAEEFFINNELSFVQKKVFEYLIQEKGYLKVDVETNVGFKINLSDISFDVTADIILKIKNRRFCFIKCAVSSIESWERYSIALCRVADQFWIPFAIVTDGENVKILDTRDGRLIAEGLLDLIPSRSDAEDLINNLDFILYPLDKVEKEKRILYAFDAIRCDIIINQRSEHH